MRRVAAIALATLALAAPARAERVVASIPESVVEIESNFVGTSLSLFGVIERDAATVGRPAGYDVVVVVTGPPTNVVARRKDRIAGIWLARDSLEFRDVPAYYAVISNRGLSLIADQQVLSRLGIGFTNIALTPTVRVPDAERIAFANALVRLKTAERLFRDDPTGVALMTGQAFTTRIPIPANIPTGTYRAVVHIFAAGTLVAREPVRFDVRKSGFEAAISRFAHGVPLGYGLAAVALAVVAGWVGGIVFRRS